MIVLRAVCSVTIRLNIADFFCCTTPNLFVDNLRSVAFALIPVYWHDFAGLFFACVGR
jgi:hypothetical protein